MMSVLTYGYVMFDDAANEMLDIAKNVVMTSTMMTELFVFAETGHRQQVLELKCTK